MTLLDTLLGRTTKPRATKVVTALGGWSTGIPLASLTNTPQERAAQYLRAYKVGWFYKAGKKIADDVAALTWRLSDGDIEESEDETTLPKPDLREDFDALSPVDQFQRLLERPNPHQTGRQLLRKTEVRIDFAGSAAWFLEGGSSGLPTALYGISPTRLWPSYDANGRLIGWVLDKDNPSGGAPFDVSEILWFTSGNAENDDIWGTSVVEAVYSQVPLTSAIAHHTATVLQLGGRLAGMMWPKNRALNEDEYVDAQRAWRNVASDPDAGRRLLLFPEPMEYAGGAATPQEIGIPELATLARDEILTAFPISPYRLGVPTPGGLNSGEVRREDRKDYWEGTIHPRADLLQETIQVGLVSLYEEAIGKTLNFSIEEPNLDDAPSLMEKTAAYKGLVSIGLDPKESLGAVGLNHIKWNGLPDLLDPAKQAMAAAAAGDAAQGDGSRAIVRDDTPKNNTTTQQTIVGKFAKSRDSIATKGVLLLADFLDGQRERVVDKLRESLPATKAARRSFAKSSPEWWDTIIENAELASVLRVIYQDTSQDGLQVVADTLGRIVPNKAVARVTDDLLSYGGERIADINARTLQAITFELAEGTRRGYSIPQLIDGVPDEGFRGVLNVGLDNGVGVWGDARAETIARTETALSYNRATLGGYKEFRVREVVAIDGDTDSECADRNGGTFSVDDAYGIADHPNGTLDWIPVVDKSAHFEPEPPTTSNQTINITMPGVTLPEPVVNVTNEVVSPSVTVQNDVKVPTVTVNNEVVTPSVTVKAPNVSVTNEVVSPSVHVTNDVQTPSVNVTNEVVTPVVNVAPAEVTVTVPEHKAVKRTVIRDKDNRIIGMEEV